MDGNKLDESGTGRALKSRLDFFSSAFDAALALSTPGLQPPNPKVRPQDYLSKCRALLPAEEPESRAARMAVKPRHKRDAIAQRKYEETRSRVEAQRARQEQQKQQGTALQRIAGAVPEGPLSLLRRAMQLQLSVRVVTRHARGVRGVATGSLVAFDGHMNLILRDVKEDYTVRLRVERTKIASRATAGNPADGEDAATQSGAEKRGKVEKSRMAWKQERRTRQLHQALLRGSSVVLVSIPPPAAPPPPPPPLGVYAPPGMYPPPHPPLTGVFAPVGMYTSSYPPPQGALPPPPGRTDREQTRQRQAQLKGTTRSADCAPPLPATPHKDATHAADDVPPPPPPEPPPPFV